MKITNKGAISQVLKTKSTTVVIPAGEDVEVDKNDAPELTEELRDHYRARKVYFSASDLKAAEDQEKQAVQDADAAAEAKRKEKEAIDEAEQKLEEAKQVLAEAAKKEETAQKLEKSANDKNNAAEEKLKEAKAKLAEATAAAKQAKAPTPSKEPAAAKTSE